MADVQGITKTYQNAAKAFIDSEKPESSDFVAGVWAFSEHLDRGNALDDKLVIVGLTALANARGEMASALAERLAREVGADEVRKIVKKFSLATKRREKPAKPVSEQGTE